MKPEVCCLNQPLEDKIPMKSSDAFVDELTDQPTKGKSLEVFLKRSYEIGDISNLSDKQKEKFRKWIEKMGIG